MGCKEGLLERFGPYPFLFGGMQQLSDFNPVSVVEDVVWPEQYRHIPLYTLMMSLPCVYCGRRPTSKEAGARQSCDGCGAQRSASMPKPKPRKIVYVDVAKMSTKQVKKTLRDWLGWFAVEKCACGSSHASPASPEEIARASS